MSRFLAAVVGFSLVAGVAAAADAKKLTLRWHGQSFFVLESSQGTRVAFDPHFIDSYPRVSVKVDLVCISHFHNDHTQVKESIANAARVKVLLGLKSDGKRTDWNILDEKVQDIRVRTVGVFHDNSEGMERGRNAVFILEVDGLRIVHLGDLGHALTPQQVKAIGPVDVLMIPVGGVYTLNGSDAKKVVEQLKPRQYVIPMHYGTKVYEDLLPIDEFVEDLKNVKRFTGNKLEVESDFKPEQPIVAVLNYQ